MQAGGYTDFSQLDTLGMSPLDHACDQSISFQRAAHAAVDLIERTLIEIINHFIETDERGYPAGYAPIHILASGVDQNFLRPELMKQLIEKKADIEATRTFSRTPAPI